MTIVSLSVLLVGCGSQDLGPLEDKTTKLRDDNHQLKIDIQELNHSINNEKSKINSLKKDKANMSKAKSNNKKVKNLEATSNYYSDINQAISKYNRIEEEISQNKGKENIKKKLDEIQRDIDEAYDKYTEDIDTSGKTSGEVKDKAKSIKKINKKLSSSLTDISEGYASKDKDKIKDGQSDLASINLNQ
ncbi:hypothetical protein [Staphylococcus auricularis]|uniref:hypothetical protein n=1 Tax=Staphylococcus auricularis TaxID=29379 RepID=UPI000D1A0C41|nr:hypothetical protein [Staphylococcus auricularis]PTH26899.1 hypothetical protein BU608_03310 [Staphylococcus auricularis]